MAQSIPSSKVDCIMLGLYYPQARNASVAEFHAHLSYIFVSRIPIQGTLHNAPHSKRTIRVEQEGMWNLWFGGVLCFDSSHLWLFLDMH